MIRVTFRQVAIMLAKALPLQGGEFRLKVEEFTKTIQGMSKESKVALRSAYVFSQKVPKQEREDLFQELFLTLWSARVGDERLAYTVARCDWMNWWKAFAFRQHYSLDSVVEDAKGNKASYGELLVGECEFERYIDGKIDGERLYETLPYWVKSLVNKRLEGKPIRWQERKLLDKWVASKPMCLASYQS